MAGATRKPVLLWFAEIGRLVLGFAVFASLARTTGPEQLGAYLAVTSIMVIVPRLLDCGLPHALAYFLRLEPAHLRSAGTALVQHLVFALPAAIAIALAIRYVPFENEAAVRLVVRHWPELALLALSELAILLGQATCVPTNRFGSYASTALAPPMALFLCVTLWSKSDLTAPRLVSILLATSLLGSLVMTAAFFLAARKAGAQPAFPRTAAYGYGLRSYASALSKVVAQRFDRLFLVGVLGASGYVQYSLAVSLRDMAIVPANLHAMTVRNRQIDLLTSSSGLVEARRVLVRVCLAWLALGVAGAIAFLPFWHLVVPVLFGPRYDGAAQFLRIVAFSAGPIAIMGFCWNHLYSMNRPGRVTMLTSSSFLLAVPVFAACTWSLGPSGGAAFAVVLWSFAAAGASFATAMFSLPPAPDVMPAP
jgi:O-antigen/teichoic acid export membrane protein